MSFDSSIGCSNFTKFHRTAPNGENRFARFMLDSRSRGVAESKEKSRNQLLIVLLYYVSLGMWMFTRGRRIFECNEKKISEDCYTGRHNETRVTHITPRIDYRFDTPSSYLYRSLSRHTSNSSFKEDERKYAICPCAASKNEIRALNSTINGDKSITFGRNG